MINVIDSYVVAAVVDVIYGIFQCAYYVSNTKKRRMRMINDLEICHLFDRKNWKRSLQMNLCSTAIYDGWKWINRCIKWATTPTRMPHIWTLSSVVSILACIASLRMNDNGDSKSSCTVYLRNVHIEIIEVTFGFTGGCDKIEDPHHQHSAGINFLLSNLHGHAAVHANLTLLNWKHHLMHQNICFQLKMLFYPLLIGIFVCLCEWSR